MEDRARSVVIAVKEEFEVVAGSSDEIRASAAALRVDRCEFYGGAKGVECGSFQSTSKPYDIMMLKKRDG